MSMIWWCSARYGVLPLILGGRTRFYRSEAPVARSSSNRPSAVSGNRFQQTRKQPADRIFGQAFLEESAQLRCADERGRSPRSLTMYATGRGELCFSVHAT